jgi:hypothetical protein
MVIKKAKQQNRRGAARKAAFLAAFRVTGTILHAAATAEVSRSTVYLWLSDDAKFAAALNLARDDFADTIIREACRRAVEGYEEPVYGQVQELIETDDGKMRTISRTGIVGSVRKFDSRLHVELLKAYAPDKFNTTRHEVTGKDGGAIMVDPGDLSDEELKWAERIVRTSMAKQGSK